MRGEESRTLQDIIVRSARRFGESAALSMVNGASLSYSGLLDRVRAVAALLGDLGVRFGDKVAILSENRPEWGIAYLAVTTSGAVAVPIMMDFPAPQIRHIIEHAECRAVIVSKSLHERVGNLEQGRALVDMEDFADLPAPSLGLPPLHEDALAAILYTSGTTGGSKAVMLSHLNIAFDARATLAIIRVRHRDRLLSILPLAHSYECTLGLVAAIMRGAAVTYLDRPPSATALLPALKKVRPTIVLSVPLVIEKIYRTKVLPELAKKRPYANPVFRLVLNRIAGRKLRRTFGGSLRAFVIGGSSPAPDVERFLLEAGFPYAVGYGLTETAPVVAGAKPGATHLRSAGRPLPGIRLRIADRRPGSAVGEIQVRGPNVTAGYYKDPERSANAFTEDGWFRTGDLGELDRRGRLYIRGRIKTMILGASGENIYPEEIEAVINQSEYVEESLVYGDGGSVNALVQLKEDVLESLGAAVQNEIGKAEKSIAVLLERIKQEVNSKVATFCRVHRIELQETPFEKTPSHKIRRALYPGGSQ